ncbi:peroxisomal targeting signal 2 receptor [Caerostris extrusa]|uniref:Peroxin-7 n=1 Tax=Caerostris extrusa TaxID=172846 RepID=A0AAV4R7V1_CAEEX|nr:peroxisomal targeting signal 2 receptor [Caerostris extrusa]
MYDVTSSFDTGEYHGYNVKYSPFRKNLLACAASQNFGLAGKGGLFILEVRNSKQITPLTHRNWVDGIYDVSWSELNPELLVTSCNDGTILIWDIILGPVKYIMFVKARRDIIFGLDLLIN